VQFLEFGEHVAPLKQFERNLSEVVLLVVHHGEDLLDRTGHVDVELFEYLQTHLAVAQDKLIGLFLNLLVDLIL
jgi:hypothetical protein